MNTHIEKAVTMYYQLKEQVFSKAAVLDGIPLLMLRLIIAPVLIIAGLHKFETFSATAQWFGSSLGMPLPEVMVFLAATTEFIGGLMLLFGVGVRIITLPLAFTMVVAILTVHLEHGWFAIGQGSAQTNPARVFAAVGIPAAKESLRNSRQISQRTREVRKLVRESGRSRWFTARGNFVVLQNGIEFAATYLAILLLLFFTGGGRYVSIDYWLSRHFASARE